ncbi:methyltransferase domain-containing protein [Candidatus Woesearchaeota archaeon]|nr:methyltransferase domain-containing protein [Candidatus Woesearchaeota archaeon]
MPNKLKDLLKWKLTQKEIDIIPSSYDIVGSILIFSDFPKKLVKKEKIVGEGLLELHKNIKTIAKKTKKYSGKYRLPKLKIISGEKTKETMHKENNSILKLNVEKVYFSSRLSTERKRIFSQVKNNESVLVMFSGCGPYPITLAKNSKPKEIYSIEINPIACKYQEENIKLNKINNIKLIKGDVKKILPKISKKFDRIIMPLPKDAEDFLDLALDKIKKNGTIHFYSFSEEDKCGSIIKIITEECQKQKKKYKITDIVKCGHFSPGVFRICVDFRVFW